MTTTQQIPGYVTGTWTIDPVHSEVGFSVRHMMVSKVRGRFTEFEGTVSTGENPLDSKVSATIQLSSIQTGNEQRDGHLRSLDFFDLAKNPTMTYSSTSVKPKGDDFVIEGELTLNGVTKSVPLTLELNGFGPDAYGGTRAGFTATTEISREEYGVTYNAAIEGGGVVIGDKVQINLEIEAVLDKA
jgi:polyisoprenoid-binding protein YceI